MGYEIITALLFLIITLWLVRGSNSGKMKGSSSTHTMKEKFKWSILAIFALPLLEAYSSMGTAKENISEFKEDGTLKCHIESFNYVVSKEDKWRVKGYYFTKDSLLVRADSCDEF